VSGEARVFGKAWVSGEARVFGKAWVSGEARVFGKAWVSGEARVFGKAWVSGKARVFGKVQVSGEAWVFDEARVFGKVQVSGKARVSKTSDLLVIGPIGSRESYLTLGNNYAATGCFCGTWEQFKKAVRETHKSSVHTKEYMAAIEFAKIRFSK
jgi:carbonic anhydrase/acetyltransferase-like protein (isoleucine patch superfamily)